MMPLVVVCLTGAYLLWLLAIVYYLLGLVAAKSQPGRQPPSQPASSTDTPYITVVVPVRDEAAHIGALLADLAAQEYPAECFEVIVVDDGSTDNTVAKAQRAAVNAPMAVRIVPLQLPVNHQGAYKKAAITQATAIARGEVIVMTDGDCRLGPQWLTALGAAFAQPGCMLVSGPVTYIEGRTLWHRMLVAELASLVGVGAAAINAGHPNMCNGANLAFRKTAFNEVGGYQGVNHVPSGDDEFLMHKVHQAYPSGVRFNASPGAVVQTAGPANLGALHQQRLRWASKWKHYKNAGIQLLAVFIYVFHLAWLAMLLFWWAWPAWWPVFALILLAKLLIEAVFLRRVLRACQKLLSVKAFVVLQLVYSFYVIYFGLASQLRPYRWKGRQVGRQLQKT